MGCTQNYNARAQPLFCSLNLMLGDVLVAVAVVVFLNSLMAAWSRPFCLVRRPRSYQRPPFLTDMTDCEFIERFRLSQARI